MSSPEHLLRCGVCLCTIQDAVVVPCGHVFCRMCVVTSMAAVRNCPSCYSDFGTLSDAEVIRSDLLVSDTVEGVRRFAAAAWARVAKLEDEKKKLEDKRNRESSEEIDSLRAKLARREIEAKLLRTLVSQKNARVDKMVEETTSLKAEIKLLREELEEEGCTVDCECCDCNGCTCGEEPTSSKKRKASRVDPPVDEASDGELSKAHQNWVKRQRPLLDFHFGE